MTAAAHPSDQRDVVSPITAAFLAELARLPAVQEGDLEAVASLACKRALDLVDARFLSVWIISSDRTSISSIVRYDGETGQRCPEIVLPIDKVTAELAALGQTTQIVSDDALNDPRLAGVHDSYLRETGVISLLEHVIRVGGTDVGLLSFERTTQTTPWQPSDLALARGVCSYLALTAVNRQRIDLEKQSANNAALQAAILENSAYAVIAADISGTITFFNRAAEQMLGYRSDEVVNKATPLLFHEPTEVEQRAAQLTADLATQIQPGFSVFTAKTLAGERNEDEWTYVRRDGSQFPVLLSITAMRNADGTINGFLGMASDVTERKQVASRLRQSEEMLSRVLLQSPDSILITALSDGRILDVNPGFEQITGYSRAEAVGRTTIDLNIWVDIAERNNMLSQVRGSDEVRSMPIRIFRRGKGIRHCVLWGRTFEYNGVAALLTSVHDVTDIKEAEQAARMAQSMLQAVLDTVPAHVFWKDRNSVYLGCNRQFAVDNGFASAADVVGTTDYDQLRNPTPDSLAEIGKVIEADRHVIASKETTAPRNVPFVMPDGTLHWMSVIKRPLLDDNGEVIGILGVQHNITEMLENERAAKNAQHMLQQVLDTIPSYVFWKDRQSRYLGSNRQFAEDAGFADPSGIVGKLDIELPWHDYADMLVDEDREVLANGNPLLERVKAFPGRQGDQRWIKTEKLPLHDAGGGLIGVLGVQHDITDQLRNEQQLRASEEKLRSLFALSPLGINLQDMSGNYIDVNDAFLDIVGYRRDELLGMSCNDLIPPEYLVEEPARLQRLRETGLIPAYEKSYFRKDGSRVPVSTATVLVAGPDGQDFKWTIVEDITIRLEARDAQRKLNDELERLVAERTAELQTAIEGLMRAEKLASLGSLVAGVAHEISTPVGNASLATSTLVGAIGEFETLLDGKLSRGSLDGFVRQVKLGVDIANRNIERVAGLIQSFKQVAVDQTSSQRRQFQMTEIVDEILTTMHPSLKRAGVSTRISVEPSLMLDSYPGPLGQVLTNLINNAILHAFPKENAAATAGKRFIDIKAQAMDAAMVRVEVRDNGAGIPAPALGRIFDPFYTSKLGQGGSGLGLHIVHNIVTDVLAGGVSVESEIGTGTVFVITLPRITPQTAAIATEVSQA